MSPARPLLVTSDLALLDELRRLCGAAGIEPDVAADANAARRSWSTAGGVLLGADLAAECRGFPRRADVVVVTTDLDDAGIWQLAVEAGAEHVAVLPDGEHWLTEWLADAGAGPEARCPVIGVVGARGGAGATTLAAALGITAANLGMRAMLVDADPLGGGIDLVVGAEAAAGIRWPELAGARGRVPPAALADVLPHTEADSRAAGDGQLLLLSWDRGDVLTVPSEAITALLTAATRTADVVIVDLPRHVDESSRLVLEHAQLTLLVVPAELRACAAGGRLVTAISPYARDLRLVVRGPAPGELGADAIASALGLPLAGQLRAEPGLAGALERGEPPAIRGRGPLARFCRQLLTEVHAERVLA